MTGLNNIISKLQNDTQIEVDEILNKARQKEKEILEKANADAKKIANEARDDTDMKVELIIKRAVSSGEIEYKRIVLSEKSKLIDKMIDEAIESFCNADDATYFSYMEKLLLANAAVGKGKVLLCANDCSRIPDGFEKMVNSKLSADKELVFSKENITADGGFVIVYDDITVDCTVGSMISEKSDVIKDEIAKVLFS